MATKIIVFDPLSSEAVKKAEGELDALLYKEWQVVSSIGGNRTGQMPSSGTSVIRETGKVSLPISKDYVVLILYKEGMETEPSS
jgi:hypothetical protein